MNRTAVAYVRVSTDRQELGPDAQRAQIAAWALRESVTVVAWFTDAGVSGAAPIEHRPGLLGAVTALRSNRAGILVAAKRDRIARDTVIAALVERATVAAGAVLLTADGASDAAGPEGVMMRGIVDVFATYERAVIRARTKSALAVKRSRGEFTGGEAPYGFTVDAGGMLRERADEQLVIAAARTLSASGLSLRAIGLELSRRGISSRTGGPFAAMQVSRMLKLLPAAAITARAA